MTKNLEKTGKKGGKKSMENVKKLNKKCQKSKEKTGIEWCKIKEKKL